MQKLLISLFLLAFLTGFSDDVSVKPIKNMSLDEIGLNVGLGFDIWSKNNADYIKNLLVYLPYSELEILKELKSKLLVSSAVAPRGGSNSVPFINYRLINLARMGNWQNIEKLIVKIPPDLLTENINKIYVTSLFFGNNEAKACDEITGFFFEYTTLYWRELSIICQAVQGKNSQVELAMNLLREDAKTISKEFREAIDNIEDKAYLRSHLAVISLGLSAEKTGFPKIAAVKYKESVSDQKRLDHLAKFYAVNDANGGKVAHVRLQELLIYALSNKLKPPQILLSLMLEKAAEKNRIGEIVILILLALDDKNIAESSLLLLTKSIKFLHKIGLTDEAKRLAIEVFVANE